MKLTLIKSCTLVLSIALVSACSVAKLEARLEANPQCKDVVNPKTGALMPCPGSDKAFYRELGLVPAKPVSAVNGPAATPPTIVGSKSSEQISSNTPISSMVSPNQAAPTQFDCKPQIHKKTGGTLPCPVPD